MTAPTFTRNSIAYKSDGPQVGVNVPRFESTGLTVEEGTSNLLTANQAGLTTDLTGFSTANGATLTRITPSQSYGVGAVKIDTPGSVTGEGINTAYDSVAGNSPLTFSCYLWGTGTVKIGFQEYTSGSSFIKNDFGGPITLTGAPTRYVFSVAATDPTCAKVKTLATTTTPQATTFYISGLQLEQKPYATSWIDGASTRAAETLTFPTSGVLSPTQGTIEMNVNVTAAMLSNASEHVLFDCTGTDATHNRIKLSHTTDAKFTLTTWDASGNTSTVSISDAAYPVGQYRFAFPYSSAYLKLFIAGMSVGSPVASPKLPSVLGSAAYLDSDYTGANQGDGQGLDLMLSSVPRPDWQLQARGQP